MVRKKKRKFIDLQAIAEIAKEQFQCKMKLWERWKAVKFVEF
jgi:hypothetical protein